MDADTVRIDGRVDPLGVTLRKSRDVELPSLAVALIVDSALAELQESLAALPGLLRERNAQTQVMLAVVGPPLALQIGSFEHGDLGIDRFVFGHGGGAAHELAAYFLARHTSIDCYEKHGIKGHAVFVTGEPPQRFVSPDHVRDLIADRLHQPIPVADLFHELQERYEVHVVVPNWVDAAADVSDGWLSLLSHTAVVRPESPATVASTIVSLVTS